MKNIQAVLQHEEYDAFVQEARKKGLSIKKAASLALRSWVEQGGKVFIEGVGRDVLMHPVFEEWQSFFCQEYAPPKRDILFFSSCFWGKPFHESWIFRRIQEALRLNEVHFVAISSAGLIPYEYWDIYPFNSYDADPWKFSPHDREAFVEINGRRVRDYIEKKSSCYKKILAYLPKNDAALKALKMGFETSSSPLPLYVIEGIEPDEGLRREDYYACLAREDSLERLKKKLEEIG